MTLFSCLGQSSQIPHFAFLGALVICATAAPACAAAHKDGDDGAAADESDVTADVTGCSVPAGCIRADRVTVLGELEYGDTSDPLSVDDPGRYRAWKFTGTAGDVVSISATATPGHAQVWLTDSEFGILAYARTPTSRAPTTINLTLPSTGSVKYYIVVRENNVYSTTFRVSLAGPPGLTFPTTRILQSDIDQGVYTADQIFHVGDFLFGDHDYTIDDGLGNALAPPIGGPNPRPNLRKIHNGKFGGPDATTCHECHDQGGGDGGGDLAHNLLQDGDGVNMSTVLPRNPPQVIGVGYLQQLGGEMTADLQNQLAAARSQAAGQTEPVTATLSSKGVSYGTVVVNTDGTVDFSGLRGVDTDLVVKPLGWKGRVANARRFVEGGFQVHLGMASQALIAKHCKTPIPGTVGDGPDCTDPDNDGVRDEITEGQLTAMALYATLLQAPVRVPPKSKTDQSRAADGEALFGQIGCTSCHLQQMTLNSSIHKELPDLSGGAGITVDLTVHVTAAGERPSPEALSRGCHEVVPPCVCADPLLLHGCHS
jgi:hypothetical protein